MKKVILFDLDGTLIDSTEAILESFRHALAVQESGLEVTDSMITSQIGHTLDAMFAGVGIPAEQIDRHVTSYKAHYRQISCQKTLLLPDAMQAIQEAAAIARLGIVTTKTGIYSRELMEHFGVMDYFEVLVGREHVVNPKPHPEPILKALEYFDVPKRDAWMIGDTRLDIEASIRAGIECVAVTSGYDNKKQLLTLTNIIEPNALEAVRFIAEKGIK